MGDSSFVLGAVILIVSLLYIYLKTHYGYWKRRNIPYEEPHLFYGNMKGVFKTVGLHEMFSATYKKFKGTAPLFGVFSFLQPSVVLLDLELIKSVLIKDFNNFSDRGFYYNERDDPLTGHLFLVDGVTWKSLRGKLTPTFTSGKMKYMFPTMMGVGESLVEVMSNEVKNNANVNIKDLLSKFTTDVIGVCAFGIDCNSLRNQDNEFRRMGENSFKTDLVAISRIISENFPNLARAMHIKRIPTEISSFYLNVVKQTVAMRQNNNIKRNDFMDILIDLFEKNSLSLEQIAAQSFVFFLAGFETSSSTMNFALYELAQNQGIQDKLRQEINDVIERHEGKITYEAINEMTYLKMVINETLRKHSVASNLRRKVLADYPTADQKYVIPKGTIALVPISQIHHDPEYYPNPQVFDPDRFSPEEVKKRHPMTFLPFGEGPRNCIGLRFGKMQTSIGLTLLIRNFRFSISNETLCPLEYSKNSVVLSPVRPVVLKVQNV